MALTFMKSSVSMAARFVSQMIQPVKSVQPPLCLQLQSPSSSSLVSNYLPTRGKHFDHHFLNRWMARDYKRRALVKKHYPERQRMLCMKKCAVLPKEFQEVVSEELHAFPRDSNFTRLKARCILSSRPRWVLHKHRVSRIHYRLLADYNKLGGVLRATW